MIDQSKETLVRGKAARMHIRTALGRDISNPTLWRWMLRGVRGVVLETVFAGGGRYTSVEAIERFRDELNRAQPQEPDSRRVAEARKALDVLGV